MFTHLLKTMGIYSSAESAFYVDQMARGFLIAMKLVKMKDVLDLTSQIDMTIFSETLTFDRLVDVSKHIKQVIAEDKILIGTPTRKHIRKQLIKSGEASGAPSN